MNRQEYGTFFTSRVMNIGMIQSNPQPTSFIGLGIHTRNSYKAVRRDGRVQRLEKSQTQKDQD